MNKKIKAVLYVTIGAVVIGGGIPLGLFIANLTSFGATDYSGIEFNAYEDNFSVISKKYNSEKDKSLSNLSNKFNGTELVLIAENKVGEHDHIATVGIGMVTATLGVKQSIYAVTVKDVDKYFMENLSKSSFAAYGKRFYQDKMVDTYNGEMIDEKSAAWPEQSEELDINSHELKWGKDLSRSSIYIVSSKTVLTQEVKIEDNNLKIHLSLDPYYSVVRYVRQMENVSNLPLPPTFHSVDIDYTIDADMNMISRDINEVYDVKSEQGLTSKNTKGHLFETVYYDEEFQFPELHENFDYSPFDSKEI